MTRARTWTVRDFSIVRGSSHRRAGSNVVFVFFVGVSACVCLRARAIVLSDSLASVVPESLRDVARAKRSRGDTLWAVGFFFGCRCVYMSSVSVYALWWWWSSSVGSATRRCTSKCRRVRTLMHNVYDRASALGKNMCSKINLATCA